ncbi:F-box protein At3g07870 [Rosa chinensis]|nr:F-box protein At3g07870 [Rosa chinensis]
MKSGKRQRKERRQLKGVCRIQQLPHALVMDILSRLSSVKILFNCRRVCKEWFNIISDPQFARLQLPRSSIGVAMLIQSYSDRKQQSNLDFTYIEEKAGSSQPWLERKKFAPLPISKYALINSCNGLLCLTGSKEGEFSFSFYVCNPILGQYITLPIPSPTFKKAWNGLCCMNDFVALGFSASANKYKVLQTDYGTREAFIYILSTRVWKSIGKAPTGTFCLSFNALLHESLHWISYGNPYPYWRIYSFNFEREKFRSLPPPSIDDQKMDNLLRLGVLESSLLLCVFPRHRVRCNGWVMKNYGVQESWTKAFVVDRNPQFARTGVYEPILFLSDGEILMKSDCGVIRYNL